MEDMGLGSKLQRQKEGTLEFRREEGQGTVLEGKRRGTGRAWAPPPQSRH